MGIKVLISINFFLLVVTGHFLPGWTADWCRCQGGDAQRYLGHSEKIQHLYIDFNPPETCVVSGFFIFPMLSGTENDIDC